MPFQSQAQWRWAFATNQPFAREWAKMTPGGKRAFLMLAKRVGTKAAMDSYKSNIPDNPALWRRAIAAAKRRFDVYPSAYANAWAVQWYKKQGGTWSSEKETHKHLPGKHDQSSHGRKGRAGQAFRAAYVSARADGKTHHQALQEGKQASAAVRDAARAERASAATTATTGRKPVARVASDGGMGLTGTTTTAFGNDPRTRYQLKHRIVEMDEVIPSNLDSGAINPRYDASLQPRQRERDASIAQIDRLAREMDTDAMTGDFYRIDFGSPIIDSNGNVLSGNGRTMALLAQRGSQYGDKSAEYRAQVERQAAELGIDPAQVARMKHPMIVRELVDTRITPQEFAHEANTSQTLRMSPKEQAVADARKIGLSMIERLPRDVEGVSVDQLLRGSAGRPFVDAWLATVPENERAGLLTANGGLNPIGLYRAKAALYTHAFPSESGQRMATSLLDSLEPDLATVQSGLSGALPHLSTAISRARSGQIDRSLDVSDDLATAIDAVARIRDLPLLERVPTRKRVETFLRQTNMFTEDGKSGLNPVQEALTRHIDRIASSQSAVRDFLDDLSARINAQPAAGQASLFGGEEPLTLKQIVDGAIASSQAKLKPAKTRKPKQATEGKPAK